MRREFDPTAVTATLQIFPKGDYEFSIGEPKHFEKKNQDGKESYGVRYSLKCERVLEGDKNMVGKRYVFTCYQHTDGAISYSKQFLIASSGYGVNADGEKTFDAAAAGKDWGFDAGDGSVGDMWREIVGSRVIISLDLGTNPNTGEPSQQTTGFRPIE
jgi:hypothetical protein